jgi:membrane protein YdbS with pleckstrin-like domain
MAEIKFKPSIKIEVITTTITFTILFIAMIIATIIFGPVALVSILYILPIILALPFAIINKIFTTYTITDDNQIIVEYKFISSSTKVFRTDQITTIALRRGFIEKMLGLGTISFGIYGKSIIQPTGQNQNMLITNKFSSIKKYKQAYEKLASYLDLKQDTHALYNENPKNNPVKFFMAIEIILVLILTFTSLYLFSKELYFIILIPLIFAIIYLLIIIKNAIKLVKIKKTKYSIYPGKVQYYHNYWVSEKIIQIPIQKITNTQNYKNAISYALFKLGKVTIYTGGSQDPTFPLLKNFEKFSEIISRLYSGENPSQIPIKNLQKDKNTYKTKPGSSFILKPLFRLTIIFSIIIIAIIIAGKYLQLRPLYITLSIILILLIPILIMLKTIIEWKNINFEFDENKMIKISGIINITQKEIYYKNIKYIELRKNFLFERILGQGTIHIYTAGSGFYDYTINSIKDYSEVYKELKDIIINERF